MNPLYHSPTAYFAVLLNEITFIQVGRFDHEKKDTLVVVVNGQFMKVYATDNKKKMDKEYKQLLTEWKKYHGGHSLVEALDIAAKNITDELEGEEENKND